MKKDMKNVKSYSKAKEEVENLKEKSITIDTLIASLGVAAIVWIWWMQVFILYQTR